MAETEATLCRGMPQRRRTASPDREVVSFLRPANVVNYLPVYSYSLPALRRSWRWLATSFGQRKHVASVTERTIEGPEVPVLLRIYTPSHSRELKPAIVWIHGGAFLLGELDTADSICRSIAASSDAVVIAVRYRLAPEHDLYAGRIDCQAAVEWIAANGHLIGVDGSRLAIGGDSAGGNIAAVVAQTCASQGGPELRMQVLAYPATDLASDRPSVKENADGFFLTSETIDWARSLIGDLDLKDPQLSPAYGKLERSVPTVILTAGFDPLRDDGLNYAMLLRQAGVPVELLHYPGQVHGFLNFSAVFLGARDALDRMGASLARALSDEPPNERQPAIDCTLEIAAKSVRTSGLRWLADEAWLTTKMSIDLVFEHQRRAVVVASRASGMSAFAPLAGRLQETAASLLLRPLGDRFVAIESRETYRAPARRAPRALRVKAG